MSQRDTPAMLADALRSTFAEHAAELARVVDGGPITRDTVTAAAIIAATSAELLTSLPLSPYWRGYLAWLGDDVDRILSIADAAELDTPAGGVG